jgi:hypothetical protein
VDLLEEALPTDDADTSGSTFQRALKGGGVRFWNLIIVVSFLQRFVDLLEDAQALNDANARDMRPPDE